MYQVKADLSLCESYANCVIAAPDIFDLDDESGLVKVLQAEVADENRAYAENAVRSCPVSALRLDRIEDR